MVRPHYEKGPDHVWVWFPEGTGLELNTETTGSQNPISTSGGGMLWNGEVYRFVVDSQGVIIFAYQVEARKAAVPDAIFIRIKPVNSAFEEHLIENAEFMRNVGRPPDGHFPTIAGVREFPMVKRGEAVKLDILYNPTTKETIYDVLSPSSEPNPHPSGSPVISSKNPVGSSSLAIDNANRAITLDVVVTDKSGKPQTDAKRLARMKGTISH